MFDDPRWGDTRRAVCAASVVVALLFFSGCADEGEPAADEFKVVPLKINVLKGVTFDDDELAEMVKVANGILKQAKLRLEFSKADVTHEASDQNNDDGKIEESEDQKLIKSNLEELKRAFGDGIGYKVNITSEVHGSASRGGVTYHKFPVSHLNPQVLPSTELRGNDLAHEICHAFTLSGDYRIDATTVAVDGHHPTDTRNLMHAIAFDFGVERGSDLTDLQREECNKGAKKHARSRTRDGDRGQVMPNDTRHCSFTDEARDVEPSHIDLVAGACFAESPTADLEFSIRLAGLHPAGRIASRFEVLLNADNDVSTGVADGAFAGIDRIVRIALGGTFPFTGQAGSMNAELVEAATRRSAALPGGSVERLVRTYDVDRPAASDHVDAIRQPIPLPALGALARTVPIGVRATDIASGEKDEAGFAFSFTRVLPSLALSPSVGRAGETVSLRGVNFPPSSPVSALLDDGEVLTARTRQDGTFSATFTVPSLSPGFYFVTARVPGMAFDFSVLTIR